MKTKIYENICSNCGTKNPFYKKNCINCKHYLRPVVANIDLWKTIWQLFESPIKAFKSIIFAEHKNFLIPLLILLSVKIYLTAFTFQSALQKIPKESNYFAYNILALCGIYIVSIIIFSFILTKITNKLNKTRFKDNLSVIAYSFVPVIFSLFILTPVEYGIFGEHWFIYNPSPLMIKKNLAYILFGLEGIMFLFNIFFLYSAMFLQTSSRIFSIFILLILLTIILAEIIFIPYLLL